jgi:hypothetical protein
MFIMNEYLQQYVISNLIGSDGFDDLKFDRNCTFGFEHYRVEWSSCRCSALHNLN